MKTQAHVGYFLLISFSVSLLGTRAVAADGADDSLKQQIVAEARSVGPNDYSFTRTAVAEQIGTDKTEKHVIVERWDPSKAVDRRWSLISVDGHAAEPKDAAAYIKGNSTRKVPSYNRLAEFFANGTRDTSSEGKTVYRLNALPKGTIVIAGSELSAAATGEATVNSAAPVPFAEQLRITMNKPTRLKVIANLERYENIMHYRLMPDGHPFPSHQSIDMTGSLLGKQGRIHTTITYTDVERIRR